MQAIVESALPVISHSPEQFQEGLDFSSNDPWDGHESSQVGMGCLVIFSMFTE